MDTQLLAQVLGLMVDIIEDLYKGNPNPNLTARKLAALRSGLGPVSPAPTASGGGSKEASNNGSSGTTDHTPMG